MFCDVEAFEGAVESFVASSSSSSSSSPSAFFCFFFFVVTSDDFRKENKESLLSPSTPLILGGFNGAFCGDNCLLLLLSSLSFSLLFTAFSVILFSLSTFESFFEARLVLLFLVVFFAFFIFLFFFAIEINVWGFLEFVLTFFPSVSLP